METKKSRPWGFRKLEGLWVLYPWTLVGAVGVWCPSNCGCAGQLPQYAEVSGCEPKAEKQLEPETTVCSNDAIWDLRPPALTGPSAAAQPSLAFLRSRLTSSEVPRPTKMLMLHRQPAVIHSDLELSYLTYHGPWSSLLSLHLSSCLSCSSYYYGL